VFDLMSSLLRKGVDLHTRVTNPAVHTSGHAVRAEQARMIELVRPSAFIPTHGTLHHLIRHADLAREQGVPQVAAVENGTPLEFDGRRLEVGATVRHGRVAISNGGEPVDRETLLRRAELARSGVVTVSLVVDGDGDFVAEPGVASFGVPALDDDGASLRQVARDVAHAFTRARCVPTDPAMAEEIRRAVRRQVYEHCGCRPVVQVQVSVTDELEGQ
jgi:ribonuclease J